jgi:hypothetical protein
MVTPKDASLNHTNIASIYGLEDSGTTHALVMELVEGPTLAAMPPRLRRNRAVITPRSRTSFFLCRVRYGLRGPRGLPGACTRTDSVIGGRACDNGAWLAAEGCQEL